MSCIAHSMRNITHLEFMAGKQSWKSQYIQLGHEILNWETHYVTKVRLYLRLIIRSKDAEHLNGPCTNDRSIMRCEQNNKFDTQR